MKFFLLPILILSSLSSFSQWITTGNNSSGDVCSALGGIFASDITTNGLYTSPDQGNTWNNSNTGVPSGGLRFGTVNGGTLYAFAGNGNAIYQSTTGNNWTLMTSAITAADVVKSMAVVGGTVLASTNPVSGIGFKIWKLSGSSWVSQSSQPTNLVAVIRNLNGTLFAGTTATCVLKSNNAGITFTNSSAGLSTATIFDKYISALGSTNGSTPTIFCGSEFGKVYASTNAGANWSPAYTTSNGSSATFINDFYTLPNNNILMASDSGFAYSLNNGLSWTKDNAGLNYGNSEYDMTHVTVIGNYIVASVKTNVSFRIMRHLLGVIANNLEYDIKSVESKAYPNPCKGEINIESGELYNWIYTNVKVYDLLGKEIGVYPMVDGKAKINTSNFNQGIYSYHIFNMDVPVSTGKIVVE